MHEMHRQLEIVDQLNWIDAKDYFAAHAVTGSPYLSDDEIHLFPRTCKCVTTNHETVAQVSRHSHARIELCGVDRVIDDDRDRRAFGQKEARRR